jgi:Ca2+-transporting ATPase
MLGSLVLTTLLLEVPFLANAFGFSSLSLTQYCIAILLALLVIPVVETVKFFQRKLSK